MPRLTVTFIELNGKPTLRLTVDGQVSDYTLSIDQLKLLIRQMVKWLTSQ